MISIIIPHLDQAEQLRSCLESLSSQESRTPVEIFVVDNGSRRVPVDICIMFKARLLLQPTPGPGPARNLGVAHAIGDVLAFIDSDCRAHPGWLAEIDRFFRENPDADILGGDVRIGCQDPQRPTWLEAYESVFAYRMQEYICKQGFTGTGNLAVRAIAFATVGPFAGIETAEDRDWGQRALRMGRRTHYSASMIAFHPARLTFAEIASKWERHIAHDFVAFRSKAMWWPRWILRTMLVAASPPFEIARIGLSDRLHGWRAKSLALLGVVIIRAYRARIMLSLAFGASASGLAARWNRV